MFRFQPVVALFVVGVLGVACGGAEFTGGSPAAGKGGGSGEAGMGSPNAGSDANAGAPSVDQAGASGVDVGGASSGGAPATGGTSGIAGAQPSGGAGGISVGSAGSGMGTAGAANPPCPVPIGYYKMITIDGAGCGDLDASVPACVAGGGAVCRYDMQSRGSKSVGGSISVQPDGSFQNATIQEGSSRRSGCQGTVSKGVLTIVCGGTDPSSDQYCSATLTRTALVCP